MPLFSKNDYLFSGKKEAESSNTTRFHKHSKGANELGTECLFSAN
jgi:hypothetical protein